MNKRQKRLLILAAFFIPVCLGTFFLVMALNENISYFYTPTNVKENTVAHQNSFRLGGLVKTGSLKKDNTSAKVDFLITDGKNDIAVSYEGLLPDLFREEQGVIAEGKMENDTFKATRILAKHDENYRPPEMEEVYKDYKKYTGENK